MNAVTATSQATSELTPEDLIRAFRIMYESRRIDDREILLKRQNKIYFQISAAGHEAIQCAAGMALIPGYDWFYPYYRDRTLALALGVTAEDMLLQAVGAVTDTASGGRQMPSHWSSPELHIVTGSSPTGTQFTQAVGSAHATQYIRPQRDEVTLVCTGEGATSEGEFWESLNVACLDRLPLLFIVEDNGYAISVPVEKQTAGGSISRLVEGFPHLLRLEIDGSDFIRSYQAVKEAAAHCRAGIGPALIHAHVTRPYSHSLSDDERTYKSAAEREQEAARDCLPRFRDLLLGETILTEQSLQRITQEIDQKLQEITDRVLKAELPSTRKEDILRHLYSEEVDPTSSEFDTEPHFSGEPKTMVDSINQTLRDELQRDDRVLMFGEDIADCSREEHLSEVKGKGGVFKATHGLQTRFGSRRVFNAPIAEAVIAGRAIGLGTRGLKAVAEIQFFDYIWPAMMQIRDEMASIRWRSNGGFGCPLVLRVPIGGYLTGGSIYHSQSGESIFTHIPGIRVVMPSNALDACGLLRTAIRCDDPVLFLEHKKLYREPYNRSPYPGPDYMIPFGKAKTVRPGEHLTIICYGALVQKSILAAQAAEQKLKKQGREISIEVIDLRSLSPYDWEAISESVQRTNRVMIVHEDNRSFGFGAEIAARIADELFTHLDAPVGRIAAMDTWVGYSPVLEDEILPQVSHVAAEAERILAF